MQTRRKKDLFVWNLTRLIMINKRYLLSRLLRSFYYGSSTGHVSGEISPAKRG